jgi:predicted PurR-regulated permease PerM
MSTSQARDPQVSPPWSSTTKRTVAVGLVVFMAFVLYLARNAIGIVAFAAVLAFLLAPLIRTLHSRARLPRPVALLTTYLLLFVSFVLIGTVVTAGVVNSISEIDPPTAIAQLRDNAIDVLDSIEVVVLFEYEFDLTEVVTPLRESLEAGALEAEQAAVDDDDGPVTVTLTRDGFLLFFGGALSSLRTVGGLIAAALISAIVTLLIALYMNLDSHKFHRALHRYVPETHQGDMERLGTEVTGIWRGYLYGQLLNSLATGILVWIALSVVGLPGAFVLGVIMALLNMIPTFGPIIAAVPGVLSAFALGSTRFEISNVAFVIVVGVIYLVVVQLQANVMAPFITGRSVRMSPASILIGLVIGVQVAGLVGAVLVVPVMATAKTLVRYTVAKLADRDPFETDAGPSESVSVMATE